MSLILGNTVISGVATPIDGSIAIGQIISSIIPLTDAGLHLLDGALIQSGGIYDDFVQYIANLFNLYPQCFTDETTWQNTVSSKGACGKFVYNSTNNTVRLPKITGFIEGTIDSSALGNLVEAGLPNITGNFGAMIPDYHSSKCSEAFSGVTIDNDSHFSWQNGSADGTCYGYSIDASHSSSIYGNSNTVQPQAIKVFYYIVIATTTKTDIEVDIDEVSSDLNALTGQISNISSTLSTKANDADVVHKTGNETINGVKITTARIEMQSTNGSTSPELLFHIPGVRYTRLIETSDGLTIQEGGGTDLDRLYAGSSDADNSVVTTLSKNKSGNGHFKLGNGLIVNWGTYGTGSGSVTITYSMPYTSAPKIFAGNNYNSTGAFPGFTNVGTTSCTIHKNSGISGWWFAIGY